jgi:hypothetical protein
MPKSSCDIWIFLINFPIGAKSALTKSGKKGMISLYNYACQTCVFMGAGRYGNNKELWRAKI